LVGGPFSPSDIEVGPRQNLWFTEANAIGKITTSGAITEYSLPDAPYDITVGPDGNLWVTEAPVVGGCRCFVNSDHPPGEKVVPERPLPN
jgi:streptogramin lyase